MSPPQRKRKAAVARRTIAKAKRSKDTVSRTVRGAFQIGVAETLLRMVEAFGPKLSEDQHVALLAFLTLLVTAVQNLLENAEFVPRLMKPKV